MKKKDGIDVLLEIYEEHMPETVYLTRNKGRYEEIVKAMDDIKKFIETIESSATFKISKDELDGTSLALEVTCTLLSMTEVDLFCNAIKKADSIDIMPLTDGNLSVTFGFKNAYVSAPANGTPEAEEWNCKVRELNEKK